MLKPDLERLIGESKKDWHFFIITANCQGLPSISRADQLIAVSRKELVLECCSCSEILADLWENSSITIVAWSRNNCSGYQLETRLLQKRDIPKMNGSPFGKALDDSDSHVRMYLLVEINKIINIKKNIPYARNNRWAGLD
ncbi:MAG: hypothetical protein ACMUHX_09615 [bacterium]